MIGIRKNKALRFKRAVSVLLILSLILSSLAVYFDFRLRKVVLNFAKSSAKTIIINCANKGVNKILENNSITYDSLAVISRNEEGIATSVEIDTVTANRLKAEITNAIAEELTQYETVNFSLPITAAFGWYISSFDFPKFDYTVHLTTTAGSNFKSNFLSAGINQVLHQILLVVNLESGLGMPNFDTDLNTSTEFLVAQTVIVGAVPEAFTSVGHATDEMIEDIFDFSAEVLN